MARKPRIQFEGAFYHIIVRGNQRQDIFLDEEDRRSYLERLQRYRIRCGFILYAYVLMTNHVHLLIETPNDPISRIMQMINFTYTQYFNRKYAKVGHLFQGRYKSYLCDKDSYLLSLVRYIHNNPVRSGLVGDAGAYAWSSHGDYFEGTKGLVNTGKVLRLFSERPVIARLKYAEFMNDSEPAKSFLPYAAHEQQIVGGEQFIEEVEKRVERVERRVKKVPVKDLVLAIEKETGISLLEMASRKRGERLRTARGIFVLLAREIGYNMMELQGILKRDISVLSRLASIGEMCAERRTLKKVRGRLNAQPQA
ncbi:MAG: transposase [Nitrospirae bacterium]|nr:transposase [Nitrospirota bacterium]